MAGIISPILWIQTLGQGKVKWYAEHHKDLISSSDLVHIFYDVISEGKDEVASRSQASRLQWLGN